MKTAKQHRAMPYNAKQRESITHIVCAHMHTRLRPSLAERAA